MEISKENIQQLLQSPDAVQARQLFQELKMALEADEVSGEQKTEYEKWAVVLQLLAIPVLPLNEVVEVLSKHVAFALRHPNIDVVDLLTQFFAPYAGPGVDQYKQEVFQALDASREKLGDIQITMPDGKKEPSTVGAWLDLHVSKVGRGRKKKNDNISYVAQDKNIAQLSSDDIKVLRDLLQLYNLLQPLPLDDARLLRLDDEDVWWGVDMPVSYKGLLVTKDDKVIDEATFVQMQRSSNSTVPTKTSEALSAKRVPPTAAPQIKSRAESVKTSADIAMKNASTLPSSVRLDLQHALEKHSNVGNIVVSSAPFVNAEGQPVQPTVRAWLQDYARIAGLDYHTLQEREAYFYESTNAKALSGTDKINVKALLQSFDDGRALTFSSDFRTIEFQDQPRKRPSFQ